jgi:hypothetical protein
MPTTSIGSPAWHTKHSTKQFSRETHRLSAISSVTIVWLRQPTFTARMRAPGAGGAGAGDAADAAADSDAGADAGVGGAAVAEQPAADPNAEAPPGPDSQASPSPR